MQLPLRMPGLGHVNCYALEDDKGFALVDPGMPGPQAWKVLVERFASAGFELRHVHTVVVTHSHIDHFGASGRLRVKADANVVTSSTFRTWWDPTDVGEEELELEDQPDPRNPWGRGTPWGGQHPRPPRRVRIKYRFLRPMTCACSIPPVACCCRVITSCRRLHRTYRASTPVLIRSATSWSRSTR